MKSFLFYAVLASLGFVLILIGVNNKDVNNYYLMLISIGGTFFGTSIGAGLSKLENNNVLKAMRISVESKFKSDEKSVERFRKKFHSYHITCKDGKFIWQYSEFNFKKVLSPGVLYCEATQTNKENRKVKYNVFGGLRKERLIFFIEGQDTDESLSLQYIHSPVKRFSITIAE